MQSKELLNFVNRSKLFVIPQNATFTFQTKHMLLRSMIDHMFVLEGGSLSRHCEPIEHIDSGINLSSHVSLLGKFNVENIYSRKCKPRENIKETPAWYKINQSDIENYQDALYYKLTCIAVPDDLINCHDLFCDKQHHQHAIRDLCVSIVSACLGTSDHTLPKRGPRKKLSPYWSDLIQSHKDCSLFWHSIWTENGKPRHGIVAQIIRQTRAKYHYFVRWAAKKSHWLTEVTHGWECGHRQHSRSVGWVQTHQQI